VGAAARGGGLRAWLSSSRATPALALDARRRHVGGVSVAKSLARGLRRHRRRDPDRCNGRLRVTFLLRWVDGPVK
jgi:hypothetical protein